MNVSMRPERIEPLDAEGAEMALVHGDHHQLACLGHSRNAKEIGSPWHAKKAIL
jgi:hypothetical protein